MAKRWSTYIHLTLVDSASILQSYCFMHHSSTCAMYVTMLFIVFMIHIIHVFHTLHMVHIVNWEQIVFLGHVGHMVHMMSMGHVALLVHLVYVGHVLRMWTRHVGHLVQMLNVGHMVCTCPLFANGSHINGFPNEYKHVFTNGSKKYIWSIPNV
jgi:hypothetical protein